MANYVSNLQFQPYVNPYVEGPTKEYAELQERLRRDYDDTALQYDSLQEAADNIISLEPDVNKKHALMAKVGDVLKSANEAGDYENRGRLVRKAILDFKKEYRPIAEQVQAYKEYEKEVHEGIKAKRWSAAHGQEMLKEALQNYGKEVNGNKGFIKTPTGEIMNSFNKFAKLRADDFDEQKHILELIKVKKPNSYESENYEIRGNAIIDIKTGKEAVYAEDLKQLIEDARNTNEPWKDYHKDLAYYKSAFTSDSQKENTKQEIIKSLDSHLITQKVLDAAVNQLRKSGKKYNNIQESAIALLKEKGFTDEKTLSALKEQYKNMDKEELFQNHIYSNQLNDAKDFAANYAYTNIKNLNHFNQFTPEYLARVKSDQAAKSTIIAEAGNDNITLDYKTQNDNIKIQKSFITSTNRELLNNNTAIEKIVGQNNRDAVIEDLNIGINDAAFAKKYNVPLESIPTIKNYYTNYKEAQNKLIEAHKSVESSERFINNISTNKQLNLKEAYNKYLEEFGSKGYRTIVTKDGEENYYPDSFNAFTNRALGYITSTEDDTPDAARISISKFINKEKAIKIVDKLDPKYGFEAPAGSEKGEGTSLGNEMKLVGDAITKNAINYKIAGTEENLLQRLIHEGVVDAKESNPQIKIIGAPAYGKGTINGDPFYIVKVEVGEGKGATQHTYRIDASLNKDKHEKALLELYHKVGTDVDENIEENFTEKNIPKINDLYKLSIGIDKSVDKGIELEGKVPRTNGSRIKYKVSRAVPVTEQNNLVDGDGNYEGTYIISQYNPTTNNWETINQRDDNGKVLLLKTIKDVKTEIGNIELN